MNLVFVCRKFNNVAGGMERMSTVIMNAMTDKGHSVALITWDSENAISHYKLSSKITWFKLNIGDPDYKASLITRLKRIFTARKFIKSFKTDVIIGFQSGGFIFGYVSSMFYGIPCVAADRVSPDTWKHVRKRFRDRILDTYLLILAKKITVQLPSYKYYYPLYLQKKIVTIPNPIFKKNIDDKNYSDVNIILNVGRLCPQKNQEFLLRAFDSIAKKYPAWKLVIVGDGNDEEHLRKISRELNIESKVTFTGSVKDVSYWYNKADIFAFPSIFEGFPNALSEALAHGLPSVGFKDTFGVNELIINNSNGILTDTNVESFADALSFLIENEEKRQQMSKEAINSVSKYDPEIIFNQWDHFFNDFYNTYNTK